MSINDLLNDDFLPIAILIGLFVGAVIFVPMFIVLFKKGSGMVYGEKETGPVCQEKAKVLSKRSQQVMMAKFNIVLFELESGKRVELAIKDITTFTLMVEGDEGILSYRGLNFIDFKRG